MFPSQRGRFDTSKQARKSVEASEIWFPRRMLKIRWKADMSNQNALTCLETRTIDHKHKKETFFLFGRGERGEDKGMKSTATCGDNWEDLRK